MKVKLADVLEAIEMADQFSEYFIDRETGEMIWISDMTMTEEEKELACEQLDIHGFYRLPASYDIREYDMMEEFIDSLPESYKNKLKTTIRGKGAFRRFKNAIRQLDIDDQWYKFQTSEFKRKAIKWCEENDLEYED